MTKIENTILLLLLLVGSLGTQAQSDRILLDGLFNDWDNKTDHFEDKSDDGRFGYDFQNLVIDNDEDHLFLNFDVGIEINLQDQNEIVLYLDTDNNAQTGYLFDGIGAELVYFFGERGGYFYQNGIQKSIGHRHIGLTTLPTVSSDRFELSLDRTIKINNELVFPNNTIRTILFQDVQNGDKLPDASGGVSFTFSNEPLNELPAYTIARTENSDFRFLSYNVLFDELFQSQSAFRRQIVGINPDIIAFQEIYDHSANQTKDLIEEFLGGNWYAAKQGSDIIMISRYPILESHFIKGNGAFLLDINGKLVLVINSHLPCCDNDSGRQEEVDAIMAFIRNSRNGQTSLDLPENTPIIIAGDMNFVGRNRQIRTIIEGDINNEFTYGSDFAPDWDGTDLKDVLSFSTNTPLAITWSQDDSSYNPGRLDYIFYTDAVIQVKNSFNLNSETLPADSLLQYAILKNDTNNSSDHFPVVADFNFGGISANVDLNEDILDYVDVFPNPFSSYFKIHFRENTQGFHNIQIFDQSGKLYFSENVDTTIIKELSIHTVKWSIGTYILIIEINGEKLLTMLTKL